MVQKICLKVAWGLLLISAVGYAELSPDGLLQRIESDGVFNSNLSAAEKAVVFKKASGDAIEISKITINYFQSNNCSGGSSGVYTTTGGPSFTLQNNQSFGLTAGATWQVGENRLSITDMTAIKSIAVIFNSTQKNIPQADFTGSACGANPSFCCVPVTCEAENCTSNMDIQSFKLKTAAEIGDPAEGGIIACLISAGDAFNLVIPSFDNSDGIAWGGSGIEIGAIESVDGANNTNKVVNCLTGGVGEGCVSPMAADTYAAGLCANYMTTGGYNDWFLAAQEQMACLYNNKAYFGGLSTARYWSSTESGSGGAIQMDATSGELGGALKISGFYVRCAKSFTL